VVKKIMEVARTGKGSFGDGKIFVSPVEDAYTVSSGIKEDADTGADLAAPAAAKVPAEAAP
jgi:nitrogen regulatory protein PII 1